MFIFPFRCPAALSATLADNAKICTKIHLFSQFLSHFSNPAEIADFEVDFDAFKKVINISKKVVKNGKKW